MKTLPPDLLDKVQLSLRTKAANQRGKKRGSVFKIKKRRSQVATNVHALDTPMPSLTLANVLRALLGVKSKTIAEACDEVGELIAQCEGHAPWPSAAHDLMLTHSEYERLLTRNAEIGSGNFGKILISRTDNMAIKIVSLESSRLRETVTELLIQHVLFVWWKHLKFWKPVNYPFPQLYQWGENKCKIHCGHRHDDQSPGRIDVCFKMFRFRRLGDRLHSQRYFQVFMQLACTIGFQDEVSQVSDDTVQFMHLDLHSGNVMVRSNSRDVVITLSSRHELVTALSERERLEAVSRGGVAVNCGHEIAIIDFGMSWLRLNGREYRNADTGCNVYADTHLEYNSQHDLRMYVVDQYVRHCIFHKTFIEIDDANLSPFGKFIKCLVDDARTIRDDDDESEDRRKFALSTDVILLRHFATMLHDIHRRIDDGKINKRDLRASVYKSMCRAIRKKYRVDPLVFLNSNGHVWGRVERGHWPPLTYFQYIYTVHNRSTPEFCATNILRRLMEWYDVSTCRWRVPDSVKRSR